MQKRIELHSEANDVTSLASNFTTVRILESSVLLIGPLGKSGGVCSNEVVRFFLV